MAYLSRQDVKPGTDLHKKIIEEVRRRVRFSEREYQEKWERWRKNDEIMVAYVPTDEADGRRKHDREQQGKPQYTTIRVPYAYGVAMSLHSYMVAVFLARTPVMQFEGLHGEGEDQVLALESLHHYQHKVGRMGPIMFSWLYDSIKYGAGVIGEYWTTKRREVMNLIPLLDPISGKVVDYEQETQEVISYKGNTLFNVAPFDFLPDPRKPMRDFQEGEFCATRQRLSWQQIKEREADGFYVNVDKIDPRIVPNFPTDNDRDRESRAIQRPSEDFYNVDLLSYGLDENKKPEIVPVYECYINIIPKDWGLGAGTYPCKWVFTVTGDWRTVIGVSPFGALHAEYPFHVNEMEFDANALANRGLPEITEGIQDTVDWLLNSHMYNVRAANNNLFLVDPMRVNLKDVTDPMPGGLIRLRPGAANLPGDPIKQLQIQDMTRQNISDMQMMNTIGEKTHGISDMLMGVAPQGGRRTATESRQTAAGGTSRATTLAGYMSVCGMQSLGMHLVSNSQQYFDAEMKVRIVGNLAQYAGQKFLMVTPEIIAGHYDFVAVDGTLPIDRFAQVNLWKEMLQGLMMDERLAATYDVGKIFAWVAQLAGLRNIDNFRIQLAQPEVLMQEQDAGNVVPLRNGSPDNLTQMPGMGNMNIGSIYG